MKVLRISCGFLCLLVVIYAQSTRVSMDEARYIPGLLDYQGYLTDTLGIPVDDSLDMTFTIYDALSGGNQLWSESWHDVVVEQGVFSVLIGDQETLPDSVFTDFANIWLELILNGTQTLSPRTRITAVGYAYTSVYSDTAEYARTAPGDNDWVVSGNRLYPGEEYGLAMRSSNVMYGAHLNTHVNFGVACTTGTLMRDYEYCTVGGGYRNGATYSSATVAGGSQNRAGYHYAVVGGGRANYNAGYYSVIAGGYADTITLTGDYSYLFGINANLTQDSTFMVDLPHIRFGDESAGYEFPVTDGSNGQALVTNGSGKLVWQEISPSSSNWSVTDSVLYTNKHWGIARGGADNVLYGDWSHTHVNLGVACTTGYYLHHNAYCTISGGYQNVASDWYATVGGGRQNTASDWYATVGGGYQNTASKEYAIVGGGWNNSALELNATVGGGYNNTAAGLYSTVGGGYSNYVAGDYTTISGGYNNYAVGEYATVCGGLGNFADSAYAVVGGGYNNNACGDYAAVVGGYVNVASCYCAAVGGGDRNNASGSCAVVGGGYADTVRAEYGGIASGWHNIAGDASTDTAAFIGGGRDNAVFAPYANVSGGYADTVRAEYGGIASGWHNIAGDASTDTAAFVGGGRDNAAFASYANVSGGYANTVHALYGGIASGWHNIAGDNSTDTGAFVGGGRDNAVLAQYACVCGGRADTVKAIYGGVISGYGNVVGDDAADTAAMVVGGLDNSVSSKYAFIGGGKENSASNTFAVVSGGCQDTASGSYSTVAGGYGNKASSYASFAANAASHATHTMSAAFTGSHTTAVLQVRAMSFSTGTLVFSMDHPSDPEGMILNQQAVGSPEPMLLYKGMAMIGDNGRVKVFLPEYFERINRNPCIQLTGCGSPDVVFVAEDIKGNSFSIGGKPGTKVYWIVTAERTDVHAEIARVLTPVEQQKTGELIGHSLDDDALIGVYDRLEQEKPGMFTFRTEEGRRIHEQARKIVGNRE
jgi:hypothetical protein